jgi:hypothetical protein
MQRLLGYILGAKRHAKKIGGFLLCFMSFVVSRGVEIPRRALLGMTKSIGIDLNKIPQIRQIFG